MQVKNNNEVKLYLDNICSKVKNKRIHEEIRQELLCHIEEMILDFLECGINEEEAIKKSLSQMGDPNVVGKELNTIHKGKIDLKLLIIVSLLISFGFLTLYSIELNFLIKNLMFTLLGVITLIGAMFLDYRKLKSYSMHIYVITLILLVFSALLYPPIGGKTGWLFLGPVTISMPLISVFLFIISLSGLFNNIKLPIKRNLLSYMMLAIIPGVMLLITKSFLLFIVYSLTLCVIMKVNNIDIKYIISNSIINIFIFFTAGGYVKIIEQYTEVSGKPQIHNIISSMLESSALFGKAKNFDPLILPDVHTDFVFTYIIYNFGWIIGAVVIILFLALVVRMIKMALSVKDSYGRVLISGIVSIFALESFFSILMSLNLIPTSYISLPFISYSGSSSLISLLVIGIVINIYKGKTLPETSVV